MGTNWQNYIESNPGKRFGKPTIKGTRITVQDVLMLFRAGLGISEIQKEYPELTEAQITACVDYAIYCAEKI